MTDQEFFQKCDNLERRIKQLEAIVGKIEAESEPKFKRVEYGEPYYYIYGNNMKVAVASDDSDYTSEVCYMHNNYFHTEKRAQEVVDKIKLLLKLERLHDIYCPDYKPNWDNPTGDKWRIYYNHNAKKWICANYSTVSFPPESSFPTRDIAQKVCDILNKELE